MKLLKTVPAIVMLAGGMFASLNAAADDSVFTVMDDPASAKKPFEGNLNAGYLAQSGNTKSSSLTADTTMTWYGQTTAWSLWGNASNTSSNDERSSEKYAAGGRSRFNLTDYDYLFGQASWLTDRYNGYERLGSASGAYAWQLTDNAKFTQGVSVFGAEDTTLNSESALNVAINEHFGLKVAYNVTWNSEPPESAPEHTDRRTTLSLGYSM